MTTAAEWLALAEKVRKAKGPEFEAADRAAMQNDGFVYSGDSLLKEPNPRAVKWVADARRIVAAFCLAKAAQAQEQENG